LFAGRYFPRRYFPAIGAVLTYVLPYEVCSLLWGSPGTAESAPVADESIAAGATLTTCLHAEGANAAAETAPTASCGDV
jgi:hypothetical protein